MIDIKTNFEKVTNNLPKGVKLVAVSKTKPNELIMQAYTLGHRIFGENKPQDLKQKHEDLPKDIEWHFIGHLQTNKVKYIVPFVSLIHAVDSLKLLKTINKEAVKNNRSINFLFQLHIAQEDTKFGLSCNELETIVTSNEFAELKNINPIGLMAMATNTLDEQIVRKEFNFVKECFDKLKSSFFKDKEDFKEISTGMSQDYQLAIEEGSTMVRIGSTLFGARN